MSVLVGIDWICSRGMIGDPHFPQKLVSGGFSDWHLGHFMLPIKNKYLYHKMQ
jgi:hypothetical protein